MKIQQHLFVLLPLVLSVAACVYSQKLPFAIGEGAKGCDLFSGKWVRDETYPLYKEAECPYIMEQLTCQAYGRPDTDYQKWRWQPNGCSLPKFNATTMLETLRGKRLLFIGDSINRGQFMSFICLLSSVIPENARTFYNKHFPNVFTATDYNATVTFHWTPYLIESNVDIPENDKPIKIVRNNSIDVNGQSWVGYDILVFDTYFWWVNKTGPTFRVKLGQGSFDESSDIIQVPTEVAYRMALENMMGWLEKHMDFSKTRVFMMSMSPAHRGSYEWGAKNGGNCYGETTMIQDPNYWGIESRKNIMQVVGDVLSKTKVPVSFVNITQLASYRKDAHQSIYKKQWFTLSPEQLANPVSYSDCVHWCVPGIGDNFNELLYAKLFYP